MAALRTLSPMVALTALIVAFSGCSGNDGGDPFDDPDPSPPVSDETGAILGLVLSDESVPLSGVQVQVRELPDRGVLTTDEEGRFQYGDLPPGHYAVDASKLGYVAISRAVDVVAGSVSELTITLEPMAAAVPYADPMSQEGRVLLSAGWNVGECAVSGITCNSIAFSDDGYEQEHAWAIDESEQLPLETLVVEVEWPIQNSVCRSDFLFDVLAPGIERDGNGGVASGDPKQFRADSYSSPIVVRIERAEMEERGIAEVDGQESSLDGDWATRVFARQGGTTNLAPADAGCSQEQPFTVYMTAFYGEPAPEGYTARPDA